MLKKLLKYGLELALERYQSGSRRKQYSGYNKFGGFRKSYDKKRKQKSKLFDLFDEWNFNNKRFD
jgi:hypothetical protein